MKKAKQPFYWFFISYNPVGRACHDFKILMHTSKGEEINFKFLFIQFKFVR